MILSIPSIRSYDRAMPIIRIYLKLQRLDPSHADEWFDTVYTYMCLIIGHNWSLVCRRTHSFAEVWGAESVGYNACGGAGSVQGVQPEERCRGGALQEVQGRCRLPAPSAPPRASYPVGRCKRCRHASAPQAPLKCQAGHNCSQGLSEPTEMPHARWLCA